MNKVQLYEVKDGATNINPLRYRLPDVGAVVYIVTPADPDGDVFVAYWDFGLDAGWVKPYFLRPVTA